MRNLNFVQNAVSFVGSNCTRKTVNLDYVICMFPDTRREDKQRAQRESVYLGQRCALRCASFRFIKRRIQWFSCVFHSHEAHKRTTQTIYSVYVCVCVSLYSFAFCGALQPGAQRSLSPNAKCKFNLENSIFFFVKFYSIQIGLGRRHTTTSCVIALNSKQFR